MLKKSTEASSYRLLNLTVINQSELILITVLKNSLNNIYKKKYI